MKISGIILGLLMVTTIPAYGGNETTRQGIVAISVLLAAGGTMVLCRRSYSKFDKILEIIGGSVLIAAGIAGVVLSGEISRVIEKGYYK